MTISAYVGLPGHGKSYGVVQHVIYPALKSSRTVFTNIPMNNDECLAATGNQVVPFETQDILDNPNWWTEVFTAGSIIVIDEVWRLWPAGVQAHRARQQDKTFINEHRHMVGDGFSTEVILVTQDLGDISTFARNKVDTTFKVVKLTKIGSKNTYRVDVYEGAVTGQSPPKAKLSRQIFGKYDPKIFKLYTSQTRGDGTLGDESRTDDRFNVLKGLAFKVIPIAIFILAFLAWKGAGQVKNHYTEPKQQYPKNHNNIQPDPNPTKTPIQPIQKTPKYRFFDEIDKIHIASNNEILGPQFLIQIDGGQAMIDGDALSAFGIEIKNISDCLILFLSDNNPIGKAVCMPDLPDSFIDRLTQKPVEISQI
jgi:zona occludens toxin